MPNSQSKIVQATSSQVSTLPFSTILIAPLESLDGSIIHIEGKATPGRLRLLDCAAFLDKNQLHIIEFPEFKPERIRYAAISYPWRDLRLAEGVRLHLGSFGVHGAEDADDISTSVLRTGCVAARFFGVDLLWLDRICMIQSSRPDKVWQIENMYSIYLHADPCLVFPGGLVRLAHITDPTTWIDRAWTLQEATASPKKTTVKCIYSFPHQTFSEFVNTSLHANRYSSKFIYFLNTGASAKAFTQYIIEPNHSAGCDLTELISRLYAASLAFQSMHPTLVEEPDAFPLRIISARSGRLLKMSGPRGGKISHLFYWQSAFIRSSSRPVDMVFSIMQSMGVKLDVASFSDQDRVKATIKLIQALLDRGHPAIWLYIAPELPPGPELSLLPAFPETSVSGRAMMQMPNGRVFASDVIGSSKTWDSQGAPTGSMDDQGYFNFRSSGARIQQQDLTGREIWGVIIGQCREVNRDPETGLISTSPRDERFKSPPRIELTLMFIELSKSSGTCKFYHRIGMEREIDQTLTVKWNWVEDSFSVGGRGGGERVRFAVREHGPVFATKEDLEREISLRALVGGLDHPGRHMVSYKG